MKKKILTIFSLLLAAICLTSCSIFKNGDDDYNKPNEEATTTEITSSVKDTYDKVYYSCFGVRNVVSSTSYSVGSCVCIKVDSGFAYLLTNRHVIEASDNTKESSSISVYFGNGFYQAATLVAATTYAERKALDSNDLALLKITVPAGKTINPVTFETGNITRGTNVISVGCPVDLAYYNTLTSGIVSKILTGEKLVQHTATINPGNSGGGLFDLEGNLVGLNVSKLEKTSTTEVISNMNYAISLDNIKSFLSAKGFTL